MERESPSIFFTPPYDHHLPNYKIVTACHLSVNRNRRKREISVRSSTCILWAEETTRKACRVMFFSALISATFFTVLVHHKIGEKGGERCLTQNQYTSFISAAVNLSLQELADQETVNLSLLLNPFTEIHLLFVLETLTFDFFS